MEYLVKPWLHQTKAIEAARELSNYGLFMEMGVGKTSTCINILREKYNANKGLMRTLIFCPPIVIENWKREFGVHSKIPSEKITCLTGSGKQRLKIFKERSQEPHVFITNYEALNMDELYNAFVEWDAQAVVCDESHRLKSYTSKRSKLMERLVNGRMQYDKRTGVYSGPRPYVYILSGSPILNSPMDIFQQYKILDAGKTFSGNFFAFRARYFRDKNAGMNRQNYFPNWVTIPGALEEIGEKLKANSMRVLKKDCMDLPPFIRQVIVAEMAPEQRKLYNSMLEDYVAYFTQDGKEHVTSATLAITKGLRLMQLASGYVKTVEDKEVNVCQGMNPKQEILKELLEELVVEQKHKVIVWASWKANYEHIREVIDLLKIKHVEVTGEVSQTNKIKAVEEFTNGDAQVFLGHPASSGIGINLVEAGYAIFYSRNFSLEQDQQAEARNFRGGTEKLHKSVTRIDIITKDSIEEQIAEALLRKEDIGVKILREITLEARKP